MKQDKQKIFKTTIKTAESIISLHTDKLGLSEEKGIDYVNSLVPNERNTIKANEIGLSWEIAERAMKNNIPKTAKRYRIVNAFEKFLFAVFAMGVIFYVCLILWWFNH